MHNETADMTCILKPSRLPPLANIQCTAFLILVLLAAASPSLAQRLDADLVAPQLRPYRPQLPEPLLRISPTPLLPGWAGPVTGTGFYVSDKGHVLTARHVIEDCSRVQVVKEGFRSNAHRVAVSSRFDLALLKVYRTHGLAAVFPIKRGLAFMDGLLAFPFDRLSNALKDRKLDHRLVANAFFAGEDGGELRLMAGVKNGTSGAPLLDRLGAVRGLIARRDGAGSVMAVGAGSIVDFLKDAGVTPVRDDRPQIAGVTARAARAGSISVGIVCY
jgi:hypothetical protein